MLRRHFALAVVVSSSAIVSGCIVAPVHPRYGGGYDRADYDGPYDPPPQPRYEVVGVAPYPGWFWIGGNWTWQARRHVWVGGRWEAPRPGYRWQPHRWQPISGGGRRGWRESPGGWHR